MIGAMISSSDWVSWGSAIADEYSPWPELNVKPFFLSERRTSSTITITTAATPPKMRRPRIPPALPPVLLPPKELDPPLDPPDEPPLRPPPPPPLTPPPPPGRKRVPSCNDAPTDRYTDSAP